MFGADPWMNGKHLAGNHPQDVGGHQACKHITFYFVRNPVDWAPSISYRKIKRTKKTVTKKVWILLEKHKKKRASSQANFHSWHDNKCNWHLIGTTYFNYQYTRNFSSTKEFQLISRTQSRIMEWQSYFIQKRKKKRKNSMHLMLNLAGTRARDCALEEIISSIICVTINM